MNNLKKPLFNQTSNIPKNVDSLKQQTTIKAKVSKISAKGKIDTQVSQSDIEATPQKKAKREKPTKK
jgi:hypothetical protein